MTENCNGIKDHALTNEQQELAKDVLERLTGKWAFWVLYRLGEANQPMRFARIRDAIEGISQKVLTKTLRQLECDGFLTRTVFPEVPPRVEYELTGLGKDVLNKISPLLSWVVTETDSFAAARAEFKEKYNAII